MKVWAYMVETWQMEYTTPEPRDGDKQLVDMPDQLWDEYVRTRAELRRLRSRLKPYTEDEAA
jgi:hypothetical protein